MNPKEILIAFYTLLRKEVVRFFRLWVQTFLPPLVTVTLYFIIFGSFMGEWIGPILGLSYLDFLVPGLLMMTVINNSFSNVVSSFYIAKFQREIEEQIVSPMPSWVIMSGYICGGVLRGLTSAFFVFCISLFFWEPQFYSFGIILFYLVAACLVFSLTGLLNAIFAKKFDDIMIFPTFILVPLSYLGGVFYSIESLPPFWQNLSYLNPILYMISGFRYGFYGITDVNIGIGIAILLVCAGSLILLNASLLKRGTGIKE